MKKNLIPKMTENMDFRPSQSHGVERSQLASISNTGDVAIAPTARTFASVQNQVFSRFGYIFFVALIFLASCFSRSTVMNRESFDAITLGEPISDVEKKVGSPYAIHDKGHSFEYEYVERVTVDQDYSLENHYFLTISEGQVVSKRVKVEKSPAYNLIYEENPNYLEY